MTKEQCLERIMDAFFGDGYISPASIQIYQEIDRLLELVNSEKLPEATERLIMIGKAFQQEGDTF